MPKNEPVQNKQLRRRLVFFIVIALSGLVILSSFLASQYITSYENKLKSDFYVGIIYCGNTTAGAKLLIDRVKTYTNLFILSNSPIIFDENATTEVCDYAVSAGLNIIVNLGTASDIDWTTFTFSPWWSWQYQWLDTAKQRWGDRFKGVYYYDEPGGRQIDADWRINASNNQLLTYDTTELFFEWVYKNDSGLTTLREKNIRVFTSDYALYWFDYKAGYDVILAEIGWNLSSVETIALVRGAATMQYKDWGVTITWRYNGTGQEDGSYLDSGNNIYQQLLTAYLCGAKYEVIFNYPTYPENNPYGIMTDEHFEALERFWKDVTALSPEAHGSNKAEVALILPRNYGWGLRNQNDKIWGAWGPDSKSAQVWNMSQTLIAHYSYNLDIIYEDPQISFTGVYDKTYFWNETFNGG
jgi:hypothetical protein